MTAAAVPATGTGLSAERVHRVTGLLRPFNEAGVLNAADVHVASRLGRLGEESDERVLLAIALTVRAVRTGSVCLELASAAGSVTGTADTVLDPGELPWPDPMEWMEACRSSELVADGPDSSWKPLRLVSGLLYLDRYWQQEDLVRKEFDARVAAAAPGADPAVLGPALHRLFPGELPDRQRLAAASVATRQVTVLAGGPGTGKTTTVAKLLALLARVARTAAADRARGADRQGRRPVARSRTVRDEQAHRTGTGPAGRRAGDHGAPIAGLAPGQRQQIPPRPHQPAAVRRRRHRRDVHGVAHADVAAARGAAAADQAGAGRRS